MGGLKPADWCATALRVHRMSASPGRSHDRLVWLWLRYTPLALAGQLAAAVWGSLGQLRAVPSAVTPVPSTDAGSGPLGPGGVGQGSVSTATAIESLADAAYACVRKASATSNASCTEEAYVELPLSFCRTPCSLPASRSVGAWSRRPEAA